MAITFLATAGFWILVGAIIIFTGKGKQWRSFLIGGGAAFVACIGGWLITGPLVALVNVSPAPPKVVAVMDPQTLIYSLVMILLGLALAFLLRSFHAEKTLTFAQNRFENMLLSANEGILEIDNHGVCTFCNLACAQMFGLQTPDQVMGCKIEDVIYADKVDQAEEKDSDDPRPVRDAVFRRDSVKDGEDLLTKADGSPFPVRFSVSPLMREGVPTGVVVTLMDMTRQKGIQRELREKERNFRGLIQNAPRGIFIHDRDGLLFVNQALAKMFDYEEPEDVFNQGGTEAFFPHHLSQAFWNNETLRLNGGEPDMSYEVAGIRRGGEAIHLEHHGQIIDWYGKVAVHSTLVDITEAKRTAELQEKTTSALRMATQANEVMLQSAEERPMLEKVCQVIVETGGYCAAWVGEKRHEGEGDADADGTDGKHSQYINPIGQWGLEDTPFQSWLKNLMECDYAGSLISRVIEEGRPAVVTDIFTDPDHEPLRKDAADIGYAALCILPMRSGDQVESVLVMCSPHAEAFLEEEVKLILTLADNLATHLQTLRAQEELKQAMDTLRLRERALEATSDGLLIADATDKDWPIVYANPAFTRITGFEIESILGRNPRILHSGDDLQEGLDTIRIALKAGESARAIIRNYRRDGSMFWNELTVAPVADQDGAVTHYVGVQHDISELKEAESLLRKSIEDAEFANRTKTDFLANMSHETRTPLNAILAFSETMKREVFGPIDNPKYREYIEDIYESGKHLLAVLNDILDFSRIERGKYTLNEEDVLIVASIEAALRILKERVEEKKLNLVTDLPDPGPLVRIDERAVKQIVINLVGNSAKFTPEGGRIDLALSVEEQGGFCLTVRDNGIGIATEDISRVTQPFTQGENVEARKHHGAGLGLSLVQNLAELHGGHVSIESEEGKGVEVKVFFPPERVLQVQAKKAKTAKKPKKLTPKSGNIAISA